jgi:excisionase family DNA binding protein
VPKTLPRTAIQKKEDDHDTSGRRQTDVANGSLSQMLDIPVRTLYRWRYKGDGPVGYRVGRHVRYRREAVEAWLEQQADQR